MLSYISFIFCIIACRTTAFGLAGMAMFACGGGGGFAGGAHTGGGGGCSGSTYTGGSL